MNRTQVMNIFFINGIIGLSLIVASGYFYEDLFLSSIMLGCGIILAALFMICFTVLSFKKSKVVKENEQVQNKV